jgi:predicted transcriptional regulator
MKKIVKAGAAKKSASPGTTMTSLRLQNDVFDRLKQLALRKGVKQTSLIQLAISEYLERETKR